jgi:hypothetical protein
VTNKQTMVTSLTAAGLALASGLAFAAGQYGPGASDTEIKIGNTMPYSGPASAYGTIGKAEVVRATAANRAWENSRPITAPICAISLAEPSLSSRAISEACRLAGTARVGDGIAATTRLIALIALRL